MSNALCQRLSPGHKNCLQFVWPGFGKVIIFKPRGGRCCHILVSCTDEIEDQIVALRQEMVWCVHEIVGIVAVSIGGEIVPIDSPYDVYLAAAQQCAVLGPCVSAVLAVGGGQFKRTAR